MNPMGILFLQSNFRTLTCSMRHDVRDAAADHSLNCCW